MALQKTPLLRPMRGNGSTLYVFPSASEDIGLNINSDTTGVALSNYMLLNFTNSNFGITEPVELARSIQNYAMNFETLLLNQPDYSFQESYTVSENVFWHWMMTHGGSKPNAFEFERISPDKNIYREKYYESGNNNRMIQCFGTIDGGNSLSTDFGMFNETYITIPTSYGNGPVFFRTVDNNNNINYKKGKTYSAGTNIIQGRTETEYSYLGVEAQYDVSQSYRTNESDDAFEVITDFTTIQSTLHDLSNGEFTQSISSFDDINVDFNDALSSIKVDNQAVYSMANGCEFKFNAILLYYSVYDLNDVYKQPIATNLFGIVFLDGGTSSTENYTLNPVIKKKSYKGQSGKNAYFGNAYSFRINIKTMSVYDNTDARIEDNTTTTSIYSEDFNDVLSNLNRAIDIMNTNVQTTRAIQDSYMSIRAELSDFREQFNEYKTQILQIINDTVNEKFQETKSELETYIEQEIKDAVAELEAYNGKQPQINQDDTEADVDAVNIYGATRLTKTTNKKVYTLGASSVQVNQNTDKYSNEITVLRDELTVANDAIEELRKEIEELKSSKNKKKK